MNKFWGNPGGAWRAGRFLLRNLTDRPAGGPERGFTESRRRDDAGTEYDLYQPDRASARTVIAVSGLTRTGERDHRFVNFCRALAESGVRVAAPALPGLKSYRFEDQDRRIIARLANALSKETGAGVGVIGFSVGGGLALAAAAEAGDAVDLAMVFGGHYDLGPLWRDVATKHQGGPPTDDLDWEDYIWLRMIRAYRDLESSGLRDEERRELTELLGDYCDTEIGKKKDFFERVIGPRPELCALAGEDDEDVLARLSPRGRVRDMKAAVMVFHDPYDLLVPADEARRLFAELQERGPAARQRLLITPLLSHVTASATWRVLDLFPLLGMTGELFR